MDKLFSRHVHFHPLLQSAGKIAAHFLLEFNKALSHGKQGIIFALLDVSAGKITATALAHDDHARLGEFAALKFKAYTLGIGIAVITGRTSGFFMGHRYG